MRVVVLTTSYPRDGDDAAGRFVADAVDHLRARGVVVEVVSPREFRHFGIAYGHGVAANLRRAPWKLALVPALLVSFARAARRAARGADLVHAHWLGAGIAAMAARTPYVVQVWGTDVELARRMPWIARVVLRRARLVIAASTALADSARDLGARDVRVIPSGVELPADTGAPADPPHVLFAGRLSAEKGIADLVEAAAGMPLVVVGDGPLRSRVPQAVGFVAPARLAEYYQRASVVACPSRREGFGVVAAEAMAWGRPVVATAVGGLRDLVVDGETGLVVPPGDVRALRAALERLLGDAALRARLGAAARERARATLGWERVTALTCAAYEEALSPREISSSRR